MTQRLADVVRQIQSVRQLEAVVTAMRGIAASQAQKGRSLLPGIDAYSKVISRAIGQALTLLPPDMASAPPLQRAKLGLILFCAEQGFAGAFSERILGAAADDIGGATCLVVGTRGAAVANERGIRPAWSAPMATRTDTIPSFANRLADAFYGYVATGRVAKIDILHSRSASGGGIQIDRHSLLPVDFGRFAAMHAFEAENEARMMAMASAKSNIGTKLTALSQRERQQRQEEITTEIIELAAGAEASQTSHRSDHPSGGCAGGQCRRQVAVKEHGK
jgi:F-type H+-transporting ATPase subunit gamma